MTWLVTSVAKLVVSVAALSVESRLWTVARNVSRLAAVVAGSVVSVDEASLGAYLSGAVTGQVSRLLAFVACLAACLLAVALQVASFAAVVA